MSSITNLATSAKKYRQDLALGKNCYVVLAKGEKGVKVWKAMDSKPSSHQALNALNGIKTALENLDKLTPEERVSALKDIRHLTKGIQNGFQIKYLQKGTKFLDAARTFFGKKTETAKINDLSREIISKVNAELKHETQSLEKLKSKLILTQEEAKKLTEDCTALWSTLGNLMTKFNTDLAADRSKNKTLFKALKSDLNKHVAEYLEKTGKSYNLSQLLYANAIMKDLAVNDLNDKNKLTPDKDTAALLLIKWGATLDDLLKGTFAQIEKGTKHHIEEKLKGVTDRNNAKYPPLVKQAIETTAKDILGDTKVEQFKQFAVNIFNKYLK